ncbi:hypothetical protein H0R92_06650 [Treponema sp. OMZ 840]|uniref:hypothetical protein n=1 Tax=Treponema sp. OMZ 840 TaxID=244313 RepID=UPI003D94611B
MKNIKTAAFFSLCVLLLYTACPHNERPGPGINPGSQDSAPYVEGGISLVVSRDKKTININVKSSNGTPIELEECTASSVPHDTYENVTAKNRIIILKPQTGADIIGLNCPNQAVLKINASGCKTLTSLTCNKNLLDSLILPADSQLTHLACAENKLTALNIQACKNLESLECGKNKLTSLDLSGLNNLTKAECWQNNLTELKLTGCTALTKLDCETNNLSALNLSNLTALTEVNCKSNKLTELTVTGCTQLAKLDISGLNQLQTVLCHGNKLNEINITDCTALKQIECYNNDLNKDAFTTLLNTLPDRTSAGTEGKAVLYKEGETGNVTDFTQPADLLAAVDTAKGHKWKLYKKTGTDTEVEI